MSKRPGGGAQAEPPPLPPGPQPQHDPAAVAAAWQQYYASQGMISQPAQPAVTPVSAPATANAYQNYGYGPGANMPGPGSMGVGVNMNMNMGGAGAANQMYGRPQNQAMGGNMGMNMMGHAGHGMGMGQMGGVGMQGVGGQQMGMGMQPQAQYAGMYGQQAAVPAQQPVVYGMQAMPTYQQPQQGMNMAPVAGPVRPYGRPLQAQAQAQIQQPYGAPGPYSSIQPAGPMTPMTPSTGRPAGNYQGTRGGRRPGGPGPSPGGPGLGMNGANGVNNGGNFPPAKRPRMEGPPQANRSAGPGAMTGSAAPSGPRSAPAGMGMGGGPSGRRGPPSEYGGSQDDSVRGGNSNGPPRGSTRGRGMSSSNGMTRGVPGMGRGRGGSFGAVSSEAGSVRGSSRPTRGSGHGLSTSVSSSYRGRGSKFIPGSSGGPSNAGAPRAPRSGARGSGAGRGGYSSTRASESFGHHRQYQGASTGPGSSNIPPKAPSTSGGKSRARLLSPTVSRATPRKGRSRDENEATSEYHEERTRVAREEARKRTMTDFRIVGLEIKHLGWSWGAVRDLAMEEDGVSAGSDADEDDDQGDDDHSDEEKEDVKPQVKAEEETTVAATSDPAVKTIKQGTAEDASKAEVKVGSTEKADSLVNGKVEVIAESGNDEDSADAPPPQLLEQIQDDVSKKEVAQSVVADPSEEVVNKRGEKRKAKMSSPDAEDDARIIAKKRNTHGPNNRTIDATSTSAPAPEKNRFRIYFASPVEQGEGISLKAYLAGKLRGDEHTEQAHEAEEDAGDEAEGEEHGDELEEDDGESAYQEEVHEETEIEEGHGNDEPLENQAERDNLAGDDEEHQEADGNALGGEEVAHGEDSLPDGTAVEQNEEDQDQAQAQQNDAEGADGTEVERSQGQELADVSMMTAEGDEDGGVADVGTDTTVDAKPENHIVGGDVATATTAEVSAQDLAQTKEEPASQAESAKIDDGEAGNALTEAQKIALKASAENASAAYGARSSRQAPVTPSGPLAYSLTDHPFRRSPSAPPTSSDVPVPTPNRLSILYADGTRRIVLDASIVHSVQIHRKRGMIKVRIGGFKQAVHEKQVENLAKKTGEMNVAVSGAELEKEEDKSELDETAAERQGAETAEDAAKPKSPVKGILLEALNEEVNVFGLGSSSSAAVSGGDDSTFPPLDMLTSSKTAEYIELTAFLDLRKRLSEPKWVKSGQLEDWINSIKSRETADDAEENWRWRKKLEIVDPDAPTTLASVLEGWAFKSNVGNLKDRRRFINSHLKEGHEFVHILLRAVQGDDYTPLSHSQFTHTRSILKTGVRPTSPYYEQQSYASLAVMAIINLVKDYSAKSGEDPSVYEGKLADIIKALPNPVVYSNTDKIFQEWQKHSPMSQRARRPGK